MNLVIQCTVDNLVNKSKTNLDWVIPNIRYRKHIDKQVLLNYWYKKMGRKGLYIRSINKLKYELNKWFSLSFWPISFTSL